MEGGRIYRKLKIWNDGLYFFSTEQEKEAAGSIFSSFFFTEFHLSEGNLLADIFFFLFKQKKMSRPDCQSFFGHPGQSV